MRNFQQEASGATWIQLPITRRLRNCGFQWSARFATGFRRSRCACTHFGAYSFVPSFQSPSGSIAAKMRRLRESILGRDRRRVVSLLVLGAIASTAHRFY